MSSQYDTPARRQHANRRRAAAVDRSIRRRAERGGAATLDEYTRFVWNVQPPDPVDLVVRLRRLAKGEKPPPSIRVDENGRILRQAEDGDWMVIGRMSSLQTRLRDDS